MMLQDRADPSAAETRMTVTDATAETPSDGPAAPAALPASAAPSPVGTARFLGSERVYWRLLIRGALLLMVTLGIYRFWLVTDMRRFLWSKTEIAGDGLEYTGTAGEILLRFLVAITLLVPIKIAFFVLGPSVLGQWSAVLRFVALGWFGHFSVYRARPHRLS